MIDVVYYLFNAFRMSTKPSRFVTEMDKGKRKKI